MSREPLRVLLVDDDEDSFVITRALFAELKHADVELDWVGTYAAGLDAMLRNEHDVYLVDYRLGAGDGIKLMQTAHERGCYGPIVMLTSQADQEVDRRAMDAGAADYLVKGEITAGNLERSIRYAHGRQALLNELERSNRELEQFASVASHDLQAPLRRVVSFSELLQKKLAGVLDETAQEYFDYMLDSVAQMQQLISDLLAFSRVGTQPQNFETLDSENLVDRALANLDVAVREAEAEVTTGPLPKVQGDAGQLTQLFQNLIGNAVKYRGARPPRVHIAAKRQVEEWHFTVTDNGIGIAPEHLERVFEMFERLNPAEQYPGTGIGLAICKKIVQRHGGKLWISESSPEGSTFSFTLASPESNNGS